MCVCVFLCVCVCVCNHLAATVLIFCSTCSYSLTLPPSLPPSLPLTPPTLPPPSLSPSFLPSPPPLLLRQGVVVSSDPWFACIFGLTTSSEVVGRSVLEFIPSLVLPTTTEELAEVCVYVVTCICEPTCVCVVHIQWLQ